MISAAHCPESDINEMVWAIISECQSMGEPTICSVEFGNGYTAEVAYDVQYRQDIGGSYEGYDFETIYSIDSERYSVNGVWDEEGNTCPELRNELNKKLAKYGDRYH